MHDPYNSNLLMRVGEATELPLWLDGAAKRGILSRLPRAVVASTITGGHRASYPSGAIVPGWEERAWAAIVLRGCMRVYLPSSDGAQITLRYMRAGDMIGAFEGTRPSLARSLQAVADSELLHFDADQLQAVAKSEPALAYEMAVEMARILRQVQRTYSIRAFGSIRLRVANAILDRATACDAAATGAVVSGTQHELAIAAGTVREVVATALQELKREGIVDVRRGRLVILDLGRLVRVADGGLGLASVD